MVMYISLSFSLYRQTFECSEFWQAKKIILAISHYQDWMVVSADK